MTLIKKNENQLEKLKGSNITTPKFIQILDKYYKSPKSLIPNFVVKDVLKKIKIKTLFTNTRPTTGKCRGDCTINTYGPLLLD